MRLYNARGYRDGRFVPGGLDFDTNIRGFDGEGGKDAHGAYIIPGLIDVLSLPGYTYPVLGLAIGEPDQDPAVKPRMPRTMQFFENTYPADADGVLDQLPAFDEEVHRYYDLRQADRPVDAFSDQVATISRQDVSQQTLLDKAAAQGFRLDQ